MVLELRFNFAHMYKHTQWCIARSKTLSFPLGPGLCSCNDSWANSFAECILWFVMLPAVSLQSLLLLCKVCTEHFHNYNLPKAEINRICTHYTWDEFVSQFWMLKIRKFKTFYLTYYYSGAHNPISFQWTLDTNCRLLNNVLYRSSSSSRSTFPPLKSNLPGFVFQYMYWVQRKPDLRWWHLHLRGDPEFSPPQTCIYLNGQPIRSQPGLASWLRLLAIEGRLTNSILAHSKHRQGDGEWLRHHVR